MKPFILEFKEKAIKREDCIDEIIYSRELNLNVIKSSGKPAITEIYLETETFTKTGGEPSDTDKDIYKNRILKHFDTSTCTLVNNEIMDSDYDNTRLKSFLDTSTITETKVEVTDSDR